MKAMVPSCTSGEASRSRHSAHSASGHAGSANHERFCVMRVIQHAAQSRFAGEAADVVHPEPFVEQRRRLAIKQQRPDERPRQEGDDGDEQAAQIGAGAPLAEERQQDRDEREHARAEQSLGQERDAGAGAEREARGAREAVQAERDAGHQRVVGNELMRVL